jgi:hypothetical protein
MTGEWGSDGSVGAPPATTGDLTLAAGKPVYDRFRARGRLAPEGLKYVSSWVTDDLRHCYQVMETDNRALLDAWMAAWADIVDFEVLPVITSAEASARVQ